MGYQAKNFRYRVRFFKGEEPLLWGSDMAESYLLSHESSQVTSCLSQSHLKFFKLNQSQVARIVESLWIIGLQARASVE